MGKSQNKTTANSQSVKAFLDSVENEQRKKDSKVILKVMKAITGLKPKMWGDTIVGFGSYHYKYDSGREGDMPKTGFSPRKTSLTIYNMPGFTKYEDLMSKLGKYRTGKSCLYIKKLEDVDMDVLKELIKTGFDYMTEKYG